MIGKKIKAKRHMIVKDAEDGSLPALHIKKGDIGMITGAGQYTNGTAYRVEINDNEVFFYQFSNVYWELAE